jgi:hypothetical protein
VFIIIFTIRVAWQKDSLALISHGFAFQGSLVGGGGGGGTNKIFPNEITQVKPRLGDEIKKP